MPKNYPRADRVEKLAREVLGEAIQELKDPRIGFVTVTGVKMSRDLRQARVFVSALGSDEDREVTIGAIQHATPHLRAILGREVRLRRLPELEIIEDQTAQNSERIEQLLRGLGVSKPPEVAPGDSPPGQGDVKGD
ncbi:MAG TPA: 30S ribosome-binding factor RbfA [Actinomycetota bacterium]|nr:30S ribosome-binding factor RbfA [Actinomycetota bacterium]